MTPVLCGLHIWRLPNLLPLPRSSCDAKCWEIDGGRSRSRAADRSVETIRMEIGRNVKNCEHLLLSKFPWTCSISAKYILKSQNHSSFQIWVGSALNCGGDSHLYFGAQTERTSLPLLLSRRRRIRLQSQVLCMQTNFCLDLFALISYRNCFSRECNEVIMAGKHADE